MGADSADRRVPNPQTTLSMPGKELMILIVACASQTLGLGNAVPAARPWMGCWVLASYPSVCGSDTAAS